MKLSCERPRLIAIVICLTQLTWFVKEAFTAHVPNHKELVWDTKGNKLPPFDLNKREWFSFKSDTSGEQEEIYDDSAEIENASTDKTKVSNSGKGVKMSKVHPKDDDDDCDDYDEIIDGDDEEDCDETSKSKSKSTTKSTVTTTFIDWNTVISSVTVTKHRKKLVPTTLVSTVTNYKWKKLPYTTTLTTTEASLATTTETFVDVDCKTSTATITKVATIPKSWRTDTVTDTSTIYKHKIKYKTTTASTSTTTTTTATSSLTDTTSTTTIVATSTTTTTSISTTTTTTICTTTTVTFPANGFLTSELGNLLTRLIPRGYDLNNNINHPHAIMVRTEAPPQAHQTFAPH